MWCQNSLGLAIKFVIKSNLELAEKVSNFQALFKMFYLIPMGWDFWLSNLQGMTAALPPLGKILIGAFLLLLLLLLLLRCIIIIIIIVIIICHQPLNVEMVSLQSTVISKHPFNWLSTSTFWQYTIISLLQTQIPLSGSSQYLEHRQDVNID